MLESALCVWLATVSSIINQPCIDDIVLITVFLWTERHMLLECMPSAAVTYAPGRSKSWARSLKQLLNKWLTLLVATAIVTLPPKYLARPELCNNIVTLADVFVICGSFYICFYAYCSSYLVAPKFLPGPNSEQHVAMSGTIFWMSGSCHTCLLPLLTSPKG